MKRKLCIACVTTLTILLAQGSAFAGGWGPYFSWGRDEPSTGFPEDLVDAVRSLPPEYWGLLGLDRDEVIRQVEEASLDVSVNHLTFGVIYESAPARDKLFSYRGTLGFDIATSISVEEVDIAGINIDDIGIDLDESSKYGLSTNHTFAFGIIRTDLLKWWVGPGIGLTFNYYSKDVDFFGQTVDFKAANLSVGGGAETGVNFNLGPRMTLCVGGGIHWRAFAFGGGPKDEDIAFVWGDGPFYFIETSLLFRTGADRS